MSSKCYLITANEMKYGNASRNGDGKNTVRAMVEMVMTITRK